MLFQDLSESQVTVIFRLLPKELAAETFVEMEPDSQELLIRAFSDRELKEMLDEMFVDDTVDIIEEMPANVVKRILKHTDPQTRKEINQILSYPKDTAGSIMTTEYVDLKKDMTVEQAFARIRKNAVDKETVYNCYVTDKNRVLLGLVSVKDLLLHENTCIIGDIMETNIIFAATLDDKEMVAQYFGKYDFLAIPVVDKENRLVGIVTFDDAMDVIEEETTEDIEKMAAMLPSDKPYMRTGVLETVRSRIFWLMLLMLSATLTSIVITRFENALAAYSVLIAFIPMLTGTGGNSGSQSSVAVIRGISLNEIAFSDLVKVVWKEIRVAVLCGVILAGTNFVKILLVDRLLLHNTEITVIIAAIICLTLIGTVVCAKTVGCILPLLAEKVGLDPAVMASPFISTVVDVMSLVIYFTIASHILGL